MGIASTIALSQSAGDQLKAAIAACENAAEAMDRGIAVLATSDDAEGPLAAARTSTLVWRDEFRTVAQELTAIVQELDRFAADLEAVQRRLIPAARDTARS